jgi:hypothetical protein
VHRIPCFQALQDEVNGGEQTTNPQDYEPLLKYKPDLACDAVALIWVCHLTLSFASV